MDAKVKNIIFAIISDQKEIKNRVNREYIV